MLSTLTLSYSISGHFKINNTDTNTEILVRIKSHIENKVRDHLSVYNLDSNHLDFNHDSDDPPFVFRTRLELPDGVDEYEEYEEYDDVFYDHRAYVIVHFPTKTELNRFKIMHEELHQYFNSEEDIRLNL